MSGMTAPSSTPENPPAATPRRGRGRPKAPPSDWEPFGTYLPESLAREFRVICAHKGIEQREGARQAVARWVEANRIPGYQPAEETSAPAHEPEEQSAPTRQHRRSKA